MTDMRDIQFLTHTADGNGRGLNPIAFSPTYTKRLMA